MKIYVKILGIKILKTLKRIVKIILTILISILTYIKLSLSKNIFSLEIDKFGRSIGLKMFKKNIRKGFELLLHPIESVRYIEFQFLLDILPKGNYNILDISSPRLFSLFWSYKNPDSKMTLINPDSIDISETIQLLKLLKLKNIVINNIGIKEIAFLINKFDIVYSISVIEHIEGDINDCKAIEIMWNSVKKGGMLILTFPVDKNYWIEYSNTRQYSLQPEVEPYGYFFQRWYSEEQIEKRLNDSINQKPFIKKYYGEVKNGWFNKYRKVSNMLLTHNALDVLKMKNHFRQYNSYIEMRGLGICCLVYRKNY